MKRCLGALELVADISTQRYVRQHVDFTSDRLAAYDYEAVERLRHYLDLLDWQEITHHYMGTISLDRLFLMSAERALLTDIKARPPCDVKPNIGSPSGSTTKSSNEGVL
ncbi:hypothetical protein ACCT19_35850 [Rhizobium ruizarguesonis]